MFGLKPMEILLIFVVILLLFGSTKLPQLGSSLGSAIRNFKRGFTGEADEKEAAAKKLAGTGGTPASIASEDKAASKQG